MTIILEESIFCTPLMAVKFKYCRFRNIKQTCLSTVKICFMNTKPKQGKYYFSTLYFVVNINQAVYMWLRVTEAHLIPFWETI